MLIVTELLIKVNTLTLTHEEKEGENPQREDGLSHALAEIATASATRSDSSMPFMQIMSAIGRPSVLGI